MSPLSQPVFCWCSGRNKGEIANHASPLQRLGNCDVLFYGAGLTVGAGAIVALGAGDVVNGADAADGGAGSGTGGVAGGRTEGVGALDAEDG